MQSLRHLALILTAVGALGTSAPALAAGGDYTFAGGTAKQQGQVKAALNASSFNWSLVPQQIVIHIAPGISSEATVGNIWLDSNLLNTGMFAWGVVQHEYAHQVDFFLLADPQRALLTQRLHAHDWCYGILGLGHRQYGCERFASTLAWAYWPDRRNSQRPTSAKAESAAMAPARFRGLLSKLLSPALPV